MKYFLFLLSISSAFSQKIELKKDLLPIELNYLIDCLPSKSVNDEKLNILFNVMETKQLFFLIKLSFYKGIFSKNFLPRNLKANEQISYKKIKSFLKSQDVNSPKLCDSERFIYSLIVGKNKFSLKNEYLKLWANFLAQKFQSKKNGTSLNPHYEKLYATILKKIDLIGFYSHKPKKLKNYVIKLKNKGEVFKELNLEIDQIFNDLKVKN